MKGKRALLVPIAASALVLVTVPAGAKPPIAKCPPAFQGAFTAAQVIEMWPPPEGFPDPEGAILSYDKNGDLKVCVLPLPTGGINIIDNAANVP
jgi:hypothetical protein